MNEKKKTNMKKNNRVVPRRKKYENEKNEQTFFEKCKQKIEHQLKQ